MGRSFAITAGSLGLACMLACISRSAPPAASPDAEQVLLLRNGEVIAGSITLVDGHYVVSRPGAQISVKVSDTELVCRDLDEGYRRKRAYIEKDDADEHLLLADWCLRHKLLGYAALELFDAVAAEPTNPKIRTLERRLELAQIESRIETKTASHGKASASKAPTNEDLDELVRSLPAGTIEAFTGTVQPLLLNTCTASGCHTTRSKAEFRLLRVPPGKAASRRLTQRNLHAVLQLVDREHPSASPLLSVPAQPHATSRTAIFGDRQSDRFRQLAKWVLLAAQPHEASTAPDVASPSPPPLQNLDKRLPSRKLFDDQPSAEPADDLPDLEPHMPGSSDLPDEEPSDPTAPRNAEDDQGEYVPVDPFDPEIFNRRFFPAE